MIRVVVADDHSVLRWGIIQVLTSQRDIEVVGEAADGTAAIATFVEQRPDVLLLDLSMPAGGGLHALAGVLAADADARVVILSAADDETTVSMVLRAGARAHVSKADDPTLLITVLRTVVGASESVPPTETPVPDPIAPPRPIRSSVHDHRPAAANQGSP